MSVITLEKTQQIATISLNRIEKHNAFDEHIIDELTQTFESLSTCQETVVIILRANGKHFSAGADLNWMQRMVEYSKHENKQDALALAKLMHTIYNHSKVVIAAAQGYTFGGGVGLIAACDFAICDNTAKFCLSEVKLGLIPAVISPYLMKVMGERITKKLCFTAELFDANTALTYNLVQEIVEPDNLTGHANQLAKQITLNGPQALTACKDLLNHISNFPIDDHVKDVTAEKIAALRVSPEGQEGLSAFFEKRAPAWIKE